MGHQGNPLRRATAHDDNFHAPKSVRLNLECKRHSHDF
jgi:hypothetical protein